MAGKRLLGELVPFFLLMLAFQVALAGRDRKFGGRPNQGRGSFHPNRQGRKKLDSSHLDNMVEVFRRNVLRLRSNRKLDLIFVIDASYSVELENFKDEIRFVQRFVSGIPVSMDTTRVAVITFADSAQTWVDQVTADNIHDHKCSLLGTALPSITYASGSTYTYGGLKRAQAIMDNARVDSKKVIILITDGRSNGGDPSNIAKRLRRDGTEILTFGVNSGNVDELNEMASDEKEDHVYILNSFADFELLARRALHADAEGGNYIVEDDSHCHKYCSGGGCCHPLGQCRCGTTTGVYECVCDPGFWGFGLLPHGCTPCPVGTYKPFPSPGGLESCTPCPDSNMLSPNGSSDVTQCTCKPGFRQVEQRCEVIRCPELRAPLNGRFTGMVCDNRYKSRCGFACDQGFDLVGSSSIKCRIDGNWVTMDGGTVQESFCQVRYCPELPQIPHGRLNCSKTDSSYRTICYQTCNEGFFLMGSPSRSCLHDQHWNGEDSSCQAIRCDPPIVPMGATVSENCRQGVGPLHYRDMCTFTCPDGYALNIPNSFSCILPNTWSTGLDTARCIDIQPPTVECPHNIETFASPQLDSAIVTWDVPVPQDNSNQTTLTPHPTVHPPATFHIGVSTITYTVVDGAGLTDECSFEVNVIDNQPPLISECNNPPPFVIPRDQFIAQNISWREPTFSDNSGTVFMNRSHEFGDMPFGQTRVQYTASDATGNSRTCVIVVSVQDNFCPQLDEPKYGFINCDMNLNNLKECYHECNSQRYGIAMHSYMESYHVCEDDGVWHPAVRLPIDCSHQRYSNELIKGYRMSYRLTTENTCNDTSFLESVRLHLVARLTPRVPHWCRPRETGINCTLVSVEVTCVTEEVIEVTTASPSNNYDYDADEYYDYGGDAERERRKRSLRRKLRQAKRKRRSPPNRGDQNYDYEPEPADAYGSYETQTEPVPSNFEPNPPTDLSSFSYTEEEAIALTREFGRTQDSLEITITIKGEIGLNDEDVVGSRKKHGQMSEFFGRLNVEPEFSGQLKRLAVRHINTSVTAFVTYAPGSYLPSANELQCPLGTVLRDAATCVNCPVGTYYDVAVIDCISCDVGFYQDDEAQLSCKACPLHTSTPTNHTRSLEECKNLCSLGTYSPNGLEVCVACDIHMYADVYGATECTTCPPDTGTPSRGATSFRQCGDLCRPGFASLTGIETCYPCPADTYQPQQGMQYCYKCPPEWYTAGTGSTELSDCIGTEEILGNYTAERLVYTDCFMEPCENGGTCEPSDGGFDCICQPGFIGTNCEMNFDECASHPCQNGGVCLDLVNEFSCTCPVGYEGVTCAFETNECASSPCLNGAICTDLLASFTCQCLLAYNGVLCEYDVNECESSPCANGAVCRDLVARFECVCTPGYAGELCDVDIDECSSNPCQNGATCHDQVNEFRCDCTLGFEGTFCEVNHDDCADVIDPCLNGGTCVDMINAYRCSCAPTFAGEACQNELMPDFDLSFERPNTYHHVHMKEGIHNMTEVTVAFYVKSNHTESEGTPFSYGVGKGPLADVLTLTNLAALTLYVNGESVVTDARKINDGQWYHVVITWKSEGGEWAIYLDHFREVGGTGLQEGTVIPGGGVLVIGQEQDCLGGCFSASQEFVGRISQFNLYDYAMTPTQVVFLHRNCEGNKGTVRAWPDALGGIVGQVEVLRPPSFCASCTPIANEDNLVPTTVNDFTTRLSCQEGYNLKVRRGANSRIISGVSLKCGNEGIWRVNGRDKPNPSALFFCSRIRCGNYPAVANADIDAVGVRFNDTVTYTCNTGYQPIQPHVITCQADKQWSSHPPECTDVNECITNPCDKMASCVNSEGSFTCTCLVGYSGEGFSCHLIDCGFPGDLFHGEIIGSSYLYQDTVLYVCNEGYYLSGDTDTLTCLAAGYWDGVRPLCEPVQCEELTPVNHGSMLVTGIVYKNNVTYTCDEGYYMVGSNFASCLSDGSWGDSIQGVATEPPYCLPVPCSKPPDIVNSFYVLNGKEDFVYGSYVRYFCIAGYSQVGDDTIYCQSNREWSSFNETFRCDPLPCPQPVVPLNGRIETVQSDGETVSHPATYTYGHSIGFVCSAGFNLVGHTKSNCSETGTWTTESPLCDAVHCGLPPEVDFATVRMDDGPHKPGPHFQSTLTYTCHAGFQLTQSSSETRLCDTDATWSGTEPVCERLVCGVPPHITHGSPELNMSMVFEDTVKYVCDLGFEITESANVECMVNGELSPLPQCTAVPCGRPPIVGYSSVVFTHPHAKHSYQSQVVYTCEPDFNIQGPSTIECMHSGAWSPEPPVCEPIQCENPVSPLNGLTMVSSIGELGHPDLYSSVSHPPRSAALTVCDDGYEVYESLGAFTSSESVSPVTPIELNKILKNSTMSEKTKAKFTKAIKSFYTPAPGALTASSSNIQPSAPPLVISRCSPTGDWLTAAPECRKMRCQEPPILNNGHVSTDNAVGAPYFYQDSLNYQCDIGYQFNSTQPLLDQPITCIYNQDTSSVEWSSLSSCVRKICSNPDFLAENHALYSVLHFPEGSTPLDDITQSTHYYETLIQYQCQSGYETNSTEDMLLANCNADQTWSNAPPHCTAKDCGVPIAQDPNGYMIPDSHTKYGSQHLYGCNEGYFSLFEGPITITCTEEGVWSSDFVQCIPVNCGAPEEPLHGYYTENVFTFPNIITYSCYPGYELFGSESVDCQPDGNWSDIAPLCEPVDCGRIAAIAHGKFYMNSTLFGNIAAFQCVSGYELFGPNTIECLSDGFWSDEPPECLPVDCGPLEEPQNGTVYGMGQHFQSTVHFSCDIGHLMFGSSNSTCLFDGLWSSDAPECFPVDCGTPPLVPNADFNWDGFLSTYTTVVVYECNAGYEFSLFNLPMVECKENGLWTPPPTCSRVKCQFPDSPVNGEILMESLPPRPYLEYEDLITYTCNSGYIPSGPVVTECTALQNWSNPPPLCMRKDCGMLPGVAHSSTNGTGHLFMDIIIYICDNGYEPVSNTVLECMDNGFWSHELPVCKPVSCGQPPNIRHASQLGGHDNESQVFESMVMYECDQGYHLSGHVTARCSADRTWRFFGENGPGGPSVTGRALCRKTPCPLPPVVENGVHINRNYTHGVTVSYECHVGHEMTQFSEELLTCTSNKGDVMGYYSGLPPACSPVQCGNPPTITNGYYVTNGVTFQKTATYSCKNNGYILTGPTQSICQSDRTWSPQPSCQPRDCGPPPIVEHAVLNITSTLYPSVVQYSCNTGYETEALSTLQCTEDGTWSARQWSCDPVPCGSPPNVSHAQFSASETTFHSEAVYKCNEGFYMNLHRRQRPTVTCLATKSWSEPLFDCLPVSCGDAPQLTSGEWSMIQKSSWQNMPGSGMLYGDASVYSCDIGYELEGNATISCTSTATFSSPPPECNPVICGTPSNRGTSHLVVLYDDITFGHSATYVCDFGFVVRYANGNETLSHTSQCTSERTWSPAIPSNACQPVECPIPPSEIEHGQIVQTVPPKSKHVYRDSVRYNCLEGYEANPESLTITCQGSGQWSAVPSCTPVVCPDPLCDHPASCVFAGKTFNQQAVITCNAGYEFADNVRSITILCAANKMWQSMNVDIITADSTGCRRHSCEEPIEIKHGSHMTNSQLYQSTVNYTCDPGYQMTDTSVTTLTCDEDKTWGPYPLPVCEAKDCGPLPCPVQANCEFGATTFGSDFRISCREGYELSRDVFHTVYQCMETGAWSNPTDFDCFPVKCSKPKKILNGKISTGNAGSRPVYLSVVGYECDHGYELDGPVEITCQSNKEFSSQPPVCKPVSCGKPAAISNGMVMYSGSTYKHNASYSCDQGYYRVGGLQWTCAADRQWVPTLSSIETANDGVFTRNRRSAEVLEGSANLEGSGITKPVENEPNPPPLAAIRSSVFAAAPLTILPTCERVPCGNAPSIENGTPVNSDTSFFYQDTVAYICDNGYRFVGRSVLTCLKDGSFGPTPHPFCERVPCGSPPSILHSVYRITSPSGGVAHNVYQDTAIYNCSSGFEHKEPHPSKLLTCSASGSWLPTHPDPCLPIVCHEPVVPLHSQVLGTSYNFRDNITYLCNEGYDLIGHAVLRCKANRKWSSPPPTCSPVSCGYPSNIHHGTHDQQSGKASRFTYLKQVNYTCEEGYEFTPNSNPILTCQSNRKWNFDSPKCVPVSCGHPDVIINGKYNGTFTYGSTVQYSCDRGYELQGEAIIHCLANRLWSNGAAMCSPVSCDHAPRVAHSQDHVLIGKNEHEVTFTGTVTYTCLPGYILTGASTLTCTHDATFDLPAPVCAPVSCGEPVMPHNGRIKTQTGILFNDSVVYECYNGFERTPGSSFTAECTENGTWSAGALECQPVPCGEPTPIIENGHVNFTNTVYQSVAVYLCIPGYEISMSNCAIGRYCMECNAHGIWENEDSVEIPVCTALNCSDPEHVEFSVSNMFNNTFGSTLEYTCEPGYELIGNPIMQCQADYSWGPDPFPICERVSCIEPEVVNATIEVMVKEPNDSSAFKFADALKVTCYPGHSMEGNKLVYNPYNLLYVSSQIHWCNSSGLWDYEFSPCVPITCSQPSYVPHGDDYWPKKDVYDFDEAIALHCIEGYESKHTSRISKCVYNNVWSHHYETPGTCSRVQCPLDPTIENGFVDSHKYKRLPFEFGSIVTFMCIQGYLIQGNANATCTASKTWSQLPVCAPAPCSPPPAIEHAFYTIEHMPIFAPPVVSDEPLPPGPYSDVGGSEPLPPDVQIHSISSLEEMPPPSLGFKLGDIVMYSCDPGYQLHNPFDNYMECGVDNQFEGPLISCEAVTCHSAPTIQNGRFNANSTTFGRTITYTCDEGYEATSLVTFICTANRTFMAGSTLQEANSQRSGCARVSCGQAPIVNNGVVVGAKRLLYLYNDEVTYACNSGYYMVGESTSRCTSDRLLIPPICLPVFCGVPAQLPNSVLVYNTTFFQDLASYQCDEGYVDDSDTISCQANGNWSMPTLLCKKVDCETPPDVEFGLVEITGTKYGDHANYTCLPGYTISGRTLSTCEASGNWSEICPLCSPVKCRPPAVIENGHHTAQGNYTFGEAVVFSCNRGYRMVGVSFALCNAEGHWSTPPPSCHRKSCGLAPFVSNSVFQPGELLFGDEVEYSCLFGYEMAGHDTVSCGPGGFLSPLPRCDPLPCQEFPRVKHATLVTDPSNGVVFGERIVFNCNEGYRLATSSNWMECTGHGKFNFTSNTVRCQPVECPMLHPIDHGTLSRDHGVFNDEVTYSCSEGYNLVGLSIVVCNANGTWTAQPVCQPVECGSAPIIKNGNVLDEERTYTYNMRVSYACDIGYEMSLINGHSRLCQADGSFTSHPITCRPVECPELPPVFNGIIDLSGTTYLTTGILICKDGYELNIGDNNVEFTCQANRTWSNDVTSVSCNPVPCDTLQPLEHGYINVKERPDTTMLNGARTTTVAGDDDVLSLHFGSAVEYLCNPGYYLSEGLNELSCMGDGSWSTTPPLCNPVECGNAPIVENARVPVMTYTFNMSAQYECLTGYIFRSVETFQMCLENGEFTDYNIACDPVSCPSPPLVENGHTSVTSAVYGVTVSYHCEHGYEMIGSDTTTCTSTGQYSTPYPLCHRISCAELPSLLFSNVVVGGTRFGDVSTIECITGFMFPDGGTTITISCGANRTWSHDIEHITCDPVPCPPAPVVKHATIKTYAIGQHVFGDVADILCDEGYELNGPDFMECSEQGQWTAESTCEPRACGQAPAVDNAYTLRDASYIYEYGDTVTYDCSTGHSLVGDAATVDCGPHGDFSLPTFRCTPVVCSEIPPIPHATTDGSGVTFGREITIRCHPGYHFSSTTEDQLVIICQQNEIWSKSPTSIQCLPNACEQLLPLTFGKITEVSGNHEPFLGPEMVNLNYPASITYLCNPGYTLVGRSKRKCQTNGAWDSHAAFCQPVDCGSLPMLLHGSIDSMDRTTFGNQARYECDVGYQLIPAESSVRTCLETASWSGLPPFCQRVSCGRHHPLSNGVLSKRGVIRYGSSVYFNCDEGYTLIGDNERTCDADGNFNGVQPICEPISCGSHPDVVNGRVEPDDVTHFGETVNITCDPGFSLYSGNETRTCQSNGNWSGDDPVCASLMVGRFSFASDFSALTDGCYAPEVEGRNVKLLHGDEILPHYELDSELHFCCMPGYRAVSQLTIQCVDGGWTDQPECASLCRHRCLHSGSCVAHDKCSCVNGWSGNRCRHPTCILPCMNGGYCSAPYTCTCSPGWTGERCQTPFCTKSCQNGGQCVSPEQCKCPYGYFGEDCSEERSYFGLYW